MDILRSLGDRVRTLRRAAGLTQEKLAEKASISAYYMGEIERGQASPSLSAINDIAKALGVKVRDLFYFPGEDETQEEIVKEIVEILESGDVSTIEDLILIRDVVKRVAGVR